MNHARILVVDDNRDLAENLVEILEDAGFTADLFDDPRKALAALVPGHYQLALLDIRMPGLDGVELYRALKRIDPALPAMVMTAFSHDDRVRAALAEGVLSVFAKPIDAAMLLARLVSAVDGMRVLVVEDDADLARNLVDVLIDQGFAARAAHTCRDAREMAMALHPAVALIDCRLPDGDGLDLVDEFCRHSDECRAMVFSGHPYELVDPNHRLRAHGATFMEKPVDLQRLLQMLEAARKRVGAVVSGPAGR